MCGFCGFNDKRSKKDKEKIIKSMADRIIHRGPDSDGYYVDNDVALGFRRLSIIDLKGGSQPIYNEDNTIAITFNGEIYNYQSLRDELIKCGHKFRTNTDTEVIVHGYEEWDTEVFNKLRGMYGIIIYDINKKKIIGARDIFGIKPFYYYNNVIILFHYLDGLHTTVGITLADDIDTILQAVYSYTVEVEDFRRNHLCSIVIDILNACWVVSL